MVLEVLRHRFVGYEHELLDNPVGDVALERDDRFDHPLVVQDDFRFLEVEIYRSTAMPALVQDLEQLAHVLEHRHEMRVLRNHRCIAVGQDRAHVGVGHPRVAVDHPVVQLVPDHRSLSVDFHQARLHQTVHLGIEAAQSCRELRREHVDRALRKIHGCRPIVRGLVEGAPFRHVLGHVGDVHAKPVVAVLQPLEGNGVVEVPRVLAVYRDRESGPEIRPPPEVLLLHTAAQPARLGNGLLPVLGNDAVLPEDDFRVHARFVDSPQHLSDAAERPARRCRPLRDLYGDHVARPGLEALARRDLHIHDEAAIKGDDESHPGLVHVVAPHRVARAALEDPDDAPFRSAVRHPLDPRHHAVAVHRLIEVAACDVDVPRHVLDRAIGNDEPKAARVGRDAADNEVHPLRETEAGPPRLNQGAVRDEQAQQPLERCPLLLRDLEPLEQLPWRGGVVDFVANQLEQLFLVQHAFNGPGFIFSQEVQRQGHRVLRIVRGGDPDRLEGLACLGVRALLELARQTLRLVEMFECRRDAAHRVSLPGIDVTLTDPPDWRLRLFEAPAGFTEVHVVQAHPRVEHMPACLRDVELLAGVLDCRLEGGTARHTPCVTQPHEHEGYAQRGERELQDAIHSG